MSTPCLWVSEVVNGELVALRHVGELTAPDHKTAAGQIEGRDPGERVKGDGKAAMSRVWAWDLRAVVRLCALFVRHIPQNHRALHGFSGQGMRPTPEGATAGTPQTRGADRAGADARGEQVE